MKQIIIASVFSKYPAGRTPEDGPNSGKRFRDEFLVPVLQTKGKVEIILDDVRSYGSSFLEEAFGGLVRLGFKKEDIMSSISIKTNSPIYEPYKSLIEQYINEAN